MSPLDSSINRGQEVHVASHYWKVPITSFWNFIEFEKVSLASGGYISNYSEISKRKHAVGLWAKCSTCILSQNSWKP